MTKKSTKDRPGANEVDDFMRQLDHPLKAEIEAVRAIILGVGTETAEGIKWNAPSFRVREYFATFNLRAKVIQVVLHQGARPTAASADGLAIDDPAGLLEWLGKDRATVKFADMKAIKSSRTAFESIVRPWVARLP